jgi:hypothetical protein
MDNRRFIPTVHQFCEADSGVRSNSFDNSSKPAEYFLSLLTPDIASFIVQETNRFASQVLKGGDISVPYLQKWEETNENEVYIFIALMMLTSRNRQRQLKEQWSNDPLLHTPIFDKTMARDRFLVVLSMLHFTDKKKQVQGGCLYKVREVLAKIKQTFVAQFSPFQNLVIDESMVLFKGRLMLKQYIKTKRHKFGIKLYILCDYETGYVLDFIVSTGAQMKMQSIPELGMSGGIVATLMKPYLNKGHSLYTDNYYTSPTLSAYLVDRKTNSCGTVQLNRKCMPVLRKKLTRGHTESLASQ